MRILHVINSADPRHGGPIEALTVRAKLLGRLGHAVEVASADNPAAPFLRDAGLPIHALGPGIGSYGFAPRLGAWLRRHGGDYDAVIVNGIWQYHAVAVRRALHATAQRYFLFPHGMLDPWFRDRYPLKHLKKLPYWWLFERHNLREAAAVLFTSEEECRRARLPFPGYRADERVAPYGIVAPPKTRAEYLEAFNAAFPALAGRRLICFMGRLHEKKGCDLLLDAFATTAAGSDLHLVVAGPDDNAHAAALKRRAATLGIADRLTWTGILRGEVKYGALAAAEAFVLPSHQENFGVAVVEALAVGTPVLISDKVNIWREVEATGAAFVEADTNVGTARLFERWLATSPAERQAMRVAASAAYRRHFDIEASIDRFLAIIGGSIDGPAERGAV